MLGKGANCALLDAVDLAETLKRPSIRISYKRRYELKRRADENVKRRTRERTRAGTIQNLVYLGDTRLREFCREKGLEVALEWIGETACGDVTVR